MDYILELISGPGNLRFVVQPLIAILLAIRDGRTDAKAGTPAYLAELVSGSGPRGATLKSSMKATLMPFSAAVILDSILQIVIFDVWRLQWALVVGLFLVGIPYVVVRSISNSLFSRHSPVSAE
jgi:hypothetical protein